MVMLCATQRPNGFVGALWITEINYWLSESDEESGVDSTVGSAGV